MTNSLRYHWNTWSEARGYPLSADEEHAFIEALRSASDNERVEHRALTTRHLMIAVVTAIRDGAEVDQVRSTTPALNLHELCEAYTDLDRRLHDAVLSWDAIVASADPTVFKSKRQAAARLMPLQINSLQDSVNDPNFSHWVRELGDAVEAMSATARGVEALMHEEQDEDRRLQLRDKLMSDETSLREHSLMLPRRVGELTPTRLSLLLGEVA